MKIKFTILILLMACRLLIFSQENYNYGSNNGFFKFGPKFGLDLNADLNNLPDMDQLAAQGNYQIGGFVQLGKKLYIQPEFLYAVQKIQDGEEIETYENFRIPVHIGLKFIDIGILSLHISGGALYTQQKNEAFVFDVNKLEYQLGAGVDIFDFITTDVRYTLRKGKTLKEQFSDFQENGGVVNLTIGLKL
ncbi:MAG: hypothetical protein PHS40_09165 [Mariniphaga sp.]|nr:hypothetical protein [Mariniphaga sp.]